MQEILFDTFFIGKYYRYVSSCHSTNLYLKELTELHKIDEGTLVLADYQTNGRGQKGANWESNIAENLTFSFVLKPDFIKVSEQFYLNIAISLGIVECLKSFCSDTVIKWPNDILINRKKVCGVLIENSILGTSINQSIVGIGLNVNQTLFQNQKATSLSIILAQDMNREELLKNLIKHIEEKYLLLKNGNRLLVKQNYIEHLLGYQVYEYYEDKDGEFQGKIIAIDQFGRIVMQKKGETQKQFTYQFKEVRFLYDR